MELKLELKIRMEHFIQNIQSKAEVSWDFCCCCCHCFIVGCGVWFGDSENFKFCLIKAINMWWLMEPYYFRHIIELKYFHLFEWRRQEQEFLRWVLVSCLGIIFLMYRLVLLQGKYTEIHLLNGTMPLEKCNKNVEDIKVSWKFGGGKIFYNFYNFNFSSLVTLHWYIRCFSDLDA